jgi:hypothetical protein
MLRHRIKPFLPAHLPCLEKCGGAQSFWKDTTFCDVISFWLRTEKGFYRVETNLSVNCSFDKEKYPEGVIRR